MRAGKWAFVIVPAVAVLAFVFGGDVMIRAFGLIQWIVLIAAWRDRTRPLFLLALFSIVATLRIALNVSPDWYGFVLATPCALAIVNQEDLTGETGQQNLPASTWQHPNWRRKMKVAVEELGSIANNLRMKSARAWGFRDCYVLAMAGRKRAAASQTL